MASRRSAALMPVEQITQPILVLRGQRIILDADLATRYGVPTKALNQAVKRNAERFPEDLMFGLSRAETEALNRSQIVTGHQKHRDPRFPPPTPSPSMAPSWPPRSSAVPARSR